jgi:hypothetical protein
MQLALAFSLVSPSCLLRYHGGGMKVKANFLVIQIYLTLYYHVCVTYKTASGLDDDWIYLQLGTPGNIALSLIYNLYSLPLHTHYDSQSSPVVSFQITHEVFWQLIPFLPLFCNCQFDSQVHIPADWRLETWLDSTQSQSHVTTDGQSASLSWNKAPIWDLRPDFYYCQTVAGLLMWSAVSDERTGLSFTIARGPCQRRHFRVRLPWDSWP